MKKIMLFGLFFCGCEPGKVAENNEESVYFNWQEGDEAPKIAEGYVYCTITSEEEYQGFIEVIADDPQGHSDIKEGVWRAFSQDDDLLADDSLECRNNDCISSFRAALHPLIQCENLQEYRFEAEVFDWQQNSTGVFELVVLDGPPP